MQKTCLYLKGLKSTTHHDEAQFQRETDQKTRYSPCQVHVPLSCCKVWVHEKSSFGFQDQTWSVLQQVLQCWVEVLDGYAELSPERCADASARRSRCPCLFTETWCSCTQVSAQLCVPEMRESNEARPWHGYFKLYCQQVPFESSGAESGKLLRPTTCKCVLWLRTGIWFFRCTAFALSCKLSNASAVQHGAWAQQSFDSC